MNARLTVAIPAIILVLSMMAAGSLADWQQVKTAESADAERIKGLLRPKSVSEQNELKDLVKRAKAAAVPLLAPELKSEVAWHRADGATLLGVTDCAEAVAPLLELMMDIAETGERTRPANKPSFSFSRTTYRVTEKSTTVAVCVAGALVSLKRHLTAKDLSVIEREYLALLQNPGGKPEDTQEALIEALGSLGVRTAVPTLCQIATTHESLGPRQKAVIALGVLEDARAIPILVSLVAVTNEGIATRGSVLAVTVELATLQEYVLAALGRFGGDPRAREAVFKALAQHPNPRVRANAAIVIAEKKFQGAVDALKLRLDDKEIVAGGVVMRSGVVAKLFSVAKEEKLPDRSVAEFAADGLAKIGSPEALTVLLDLTSNLDANKDSALLRAAIQGLGSFKEDPAANRLVALAQPNDKTVLKEIIVSLGRTGNPKAVDFLTIRASNKELAPSEREAAIEALGNPAYRVAVPALVELLGDHTLVRTSKGLGVLEIRETICYHTAGALAAIGDPAALEGLQRSIEAGQLHEDELNQIRSAIARITGSEKD